MIGKSEKINLENIQEVKGDNISDVNVPLTVAEFELWLLEQPELADKRFEFVEGRMIEKEGMKQNEFFIVKFLSRLFVKTAMYEMGGEFISEGDALDMRTNKITAATFAFVSPLEQRKSDY